MAEIPSPLARAKAAAAGQPEAPVEEPEQAAPSGEQVPNHYCLEARHAAELISEERFFYFEQPLKKVRQPNGDFVEVPAGVCPVCPVCKDRNGQPRQVSAAEVEYDDQGRPLIPSTLLVLSDRI